MQERKGATETSMLICQWRLSNWLVKCAGFVAVLLDHTRGWRRVSWRFTSICVANHFHIFAALWQAVTCGTKIIPRVKLALVLGIYRDFCWSGSIVPHVLCQLIDFLRIAISGVYDFFCRLRWSIEDHDQTNAPNQVSNATRLIGNLMLDGDRLRVHKAVIIADIWC